MLTCCYRFYPENQPRFYKGVDLSVNGLVDSVTKERILQLLNNEYYEGEIEHLVNRQMKKNTKLKKEEFIKYLKSDYIFYIDYLFDMCGMLDDEDIKTTLIRLYEEEGEKKLGKDYMWNLLRALARMGVEPYLSQYINKYKYNENDDAEKMRRKIERLYTLYRRKEALLEISRYMSTKKYEITYVISDSIPEEEEELEEENPIIAFPIESPEVKYETEIEYIKVHAYLIIISFVSNKELLGFAGLQSFPTWEEEENLLKKLTSRKCKKIQKWMVKNFDNYELVKCW